MYLSKDEKEIIKQRIVEQLKTQAEIERIVIFGSFLNSDEPNDLDLAIFQSSTENYLTLSLRYRKIIRDIARKIPVDLIPLISGKTNDFVLDEIETGETIYERKY